MASLSRGQLFEIRAWTGTAEPSDEQLNNRWQDLAFGNVLEVARQVLQERLGDLLAGPAAFNAQGDYSEDNKATIATLRQQIADLSIVLDGNAIPGQDLTTVVEPATMVRSDRERLNFG